VVKDPKPAYQQVATLVEPKAKASGTMPPKSGTDQLISIFSTVLPEGQQRTRFQKRRVICRAIKPTIGDVLLIYVDTHLV
jgi:hypothetical protein